MIYYINWSFKRSILSWLEASSWIRWQYFLYQTLEFMLDKFEDTYGSDGKESACNSGELGSIPGLGRSPGEWNGYSLQYSWLENSMDRGAWRATVHGVAKSQTRLSDKHFHSLFSVDWCLGWIFKNSHNWASIWWSSQYLPKRAGCIARRLHL